MSWQLGSFAILGLGLVGGFAWYERTRPDARIVALVATLAAFAALGRIAFAAVPNVKPTTDIVLVSGYALGGAPGFVVGALAGLTSNFFFGQGPWTPWQMAAWAGIGVLGAGLAIATNRKIGRWPLAIVCAVAGFALTAVQDACDWVTYSDHSLAALGVYVGKGLGFDAVHAGGCLVFALAFGPALTRSVARFAARLQVTWQPAGRAVASAVLALLALPLAAGLSAAPPARAAAGPAAYLLAAQNPDGGFGSAPGESSDGLFSGWAALGLAAEGHNPQDVRHGGRSVVDYISAHGPSDVGSLERTILVLRAAGLPATSFAGQNLTATLQHDIRHDGSIAEQVNLTSFAVLALRAAGLPAPPRTITWLLRQQDQDGGFNFATAGAGSDVDDTGATLEALAGVQGTAVTLARARAVSFIRRQQNRDGGFPADLGASSNAQSTAWGVQGLLAAGVDPDSLHREGAPSPLAYLQSLIAADGHVRYSRSSDQTPVWVTGEAVLALARQPLPLAPVPLAPASRPSRPHPRRFSANPTPVRSPQPEQPSTGSRRRARPAPVRRSVEAPSASSSLDGLAVDAAIVTALVLAPVGGG